MRPNTASGLLQIGHELEKRQWRHNLLTWRHCRIFFDVVLFLLSSLVSAVMDSFFYKGLTRNPRIRNTPVWVFPNIWRLGWVRDTKLVMVVSNKVLPNAAKCQGYSFYCFWVIKGKPTGLSLQFYFKKDSGTGVFLWIFYRTPPGDCFCNILALVSVERLEA